MARHKKSIDEKYNQPFATRFRLLMNTGKRTSQAEIAEAVGKSRQVISQYYNGESEPPYDTLVKIAQYFHVTVDYMIGATEVSSTSLDVKEIIRQTGISEENVTELIEKNRWAKNMERILINAGADPNEKCIDPQGLLLNALIKYALQKDTNTSFMEIIDTLETPSSEAFIAIIEKDEAFQDVVHRDAIRMGVEVFFRQGELEDELDWPMINHGMWNLTPEDAFDYYCLRMGDGLKKHLTAEFKDTAKWSDIEPYREKLREEIDKIDSGWDEMMQEAERKWRASKKETEATE